MYFMWPFLQALIATLPPMAYVIFLWLMLAVVFALLGMALFGDLLFRCSSGAEYPEGKAECSGYQSESSVGILLPRAWYSPSYNFDSFPTALLTLFRITFVKYIDIMRDAMDISWKDTSPMQMNSPHHSLYFVVYILLSAYFIMNVFIA